LRREKAAGQIEPRDDARIIQPAVGDRRLEAVQRYPLDADLVILVAALVPFNSI
jgi:hypothetical protein